MAQIPSYEQWMKDTHTLTRPRSEPLKKLDEAVKSQNKAAIKVALDDWKFDQSRQGKDWRKSVRNEKGAVTNLYRAVNDLDKRNLTPQELEGFQFISRQQALALQKQFEGKQLKFKANTLVGLANNAGSKWQKFKTGASAVKSGGSTAKDLYDGAKGIATGVSVLKQGGRAAAQAAAKTDMTDKFDTIKKSITEFCQHLCPSLDPNHVFTALHLGSVESFAVSLTPFVGAISSGGKAIIGWIGVAKRCYDGIKVADARYAIAAGDPEAAFDAVLELIDRDIKSEMGKASTKTVAFTGKLLGAFADAGAVTGPTIGLLEILADIFQTIVEYVRDYKECQMGNEMLRLGALNLDLFTTCPLLGCYFLVIQDHSTIINFAVGDYGTPNFTFDVERLIKRIEVVLDKSRSYIKVSRLEIPNMEHAKGIVEQNYSVKTGISKVTGAPGAIKDKISERLEAWMVKPEKPPSVDKSRIVGISWDSLPRT